MSEKREKDCIQLSLDFGDVRQNFRSHKGDGEGYSGNVISFTDSRTLAVRRDALRRVVEAGIFKPSKDVQ